VTAAFRKHSKKFPIKGLRASPLLDYLPLEMLPLKDKADSTRSKADEDCFSLSHSLRRFVFILFRFAVQIDRSRADDFGFAKILRWHGAMTAKAICVIHRLAPTHRFSRRRSGSHSPSRVLPLTHCRERYKIGKA